MGPAGAAGAQGPTGPAGPPANVIGYANSGTSDVLLSTADTYFTVVSTVPVSTTGTYIVNASLILVVRNLDNVECGFFLASTGNAVGVPSQTGTNANSGYVNELKSIPVTAAFPVSAGDSIEIACLSDVGGSDVTGYTMTAILLNHIN
jgi:hypothetical protein